MRDRLRLTLRDGRTAVLRGLTRRDAEAYRAHLLRLSPQDRRLRFHGTTGEERVADYVRRLNWSRAFLFGIFIEDELRAVAELFPTTADEGELALSVETPFQHLGLGRVLFTALRIIGRIAGMQAIRLIWLPENRAMYRLTRRAGGATETLEGVAEGTLPLGHWDQAPEYKPS